MDTIKRICWMILLLWAMILPVRGEGVTPIYTPQDLLAVAENPEGEYILMEDLDMTGIEWIGPDFSGKLNGNGHSILNLTITGTGESTAVVMDGNQKPYDAVFAGLFGKLENAEIRDLKLYNVRSVITSDMPCFLAGIAGYSMDSSVINCSVSGQLELRAHDRMFGIAGVLGYGVGSVENCQIDMELICVDTDSATRDEQFLGGVFGMGFMTVADSEIHLDAYISEHGYVHSGGIAGMLMQYPVGMGRASRIVRNNVDARITFFEDNTDRRAYCEPTVGELLLNFNYGIMDNQRHLEKHEVKEYDRELRPETCENPVYTETVVASLCDTYGYTEYVCNGCGYTYQDHYTLFSHNVENWTVITAATTESPGESLGICVRCGAEVTREDPVLPPEPETIPEVQVETNGELVGAAPVTDEAPAKPLTPAQTRKASPELLWILAGFAVLAVAAGLLAFSLWHTPKGKHVKKRWDK